MGANEAKCIAERNSTAKVIAPAMVKGAWPSSPRGNFRSELLRSRTIPLHLKCHMEPLIAWKYNWWTYTSCVI
jgi:hypothetical protein